MKKHWIKIAKLKKEKRLIFFKKSRRFYIKGQFYNALHTPLKFHKPKEKVHITREEIVPVWRKNKDGEYEIERFDILNKEE